MRSKGLIQVMTRDVRPGLGRGRAVSVHFHGKNAKKRSFSSRPQNGSCRTILMNLSYKTQCKMRVNLGCTNLSCISLDILISFDIL